MSKKVNKRVKAPLSERFGALFARTVPGSAVKLGRNTAKAAKSAQHIGQGIVRGFKKEWEEI